jgi:hypothetical protein
MSGFQNVLNDINVVFKKFMCPTHNILEPTTGVTFFNNGSKSDPTELFPSIVQVIAG